MSRYMYIKDTAYSYCIFALHIMIITKQKWTGEKMQIKKKLKLIQFQLY